jgi:hypothetical protein
MTFDRYPRRGYEIRCDNDYPACSRPCPHLQTDGRNHHDTTGITLGARNLLLLGLAVIGLFGLRQLNCAPYRLKIYDEHNRIETVIDLLGSYYRPIKEDEDAGGGVRFHNFEDAKEAFRNYDSPKIAFFRALRAQTQRDLLERQNQPSIQR